MTADARSGEVTAATRRRWAVRTAVLAAALVVLIPLFAFAVEMGTQVPRDGITTSTVLGTFFVLAALVLLVANAVWAAGGERAPRGRWVPWLAVGLAALGVVLAAVRYDPGADALAPVIVAAGGGLALTVLVNQSLRVARAR